MFNPAISFSELFSTLGSWWSREYSGRDQAAAIVYGEHVGAAQSLEDMSATVDAASRLLIRPYRTVEWYPVEIKQDATAIPPDPNYPFAYVCSNQLRGASAALDLILNPAVYWTSADFQITDGIISFATDPFSQSFVQYTKGTAVNEGISLACEIWLRHAELDTQNIAKQYGYPLSISRRSSPSYKRLLNAVYDAMTYGPTDYAIRNLLSEGTAIPICQIDGEVVEVIGARNVGETFVATDKSIYKFQLDQTAIVVKGQVLSLGEPITDAITFVNIFQQNLLTYKAWWGSTLVTRGYLDTCTDDTLVFDNKLVNITLTTSQGFTKITWPMPGDQAVAANFFNSLHARGVLLAQRDAACLSREQKILDTRIAVDPPVYYAKGTLAHWIRGQAAASGEPIASDLPIQINPMQVLFDWVFGHNMLVIRTRSVSRGDNQNSLSDLTALRRVLPSSLNILFLLELGGQRQVTLAGSGSIQRQLGANPLSQVTTASDHIRRLNYVND